MPLSSKHPRYAEAQPDWRIVRGTHAGERRVEEQGTSYLPATSGMIAAGLGGIGSAHVGRQREDGQVKAVGSRDPRNPGQAQYDAYVTRAVFHELVQSPRL